MPAMETPLKYLLLFTGFSACAQFDSGAGFFRVGPGSARCLCSWPGALAAFENYLTKDLQLTTKDEGPELGAALMF